MITSIILATIFQTLTPDEVKALTYLREEEKLALDVYTELGRVHKMRIFQNISRAEAQHTESIKTLLIEFNLPDPAAKSKPGEFQDKDLQKLYIDLVTKGKKSIPDALTVGATIEDKDIFDLNKSLKTTAHPKLVTTLNTLKSGSENHMRAFYRQLKNQGITYKPQFIPQTTLNSIINPPTTQ